jgi:flagellar assembly protein FliH
MSSPDAFRPFGADAPAPAFRPFGVPAPEVEPPAPVDAPPDEPEEERRRAFQAGYELGREETRSQLESVGESLVKSLEELAEFRTRLRERYERELLELALGVARKVVQQELAERPQIWLGMIRAAVRRAVDRERIVVRVPAHLHAFLRDSLPELRAALEDVKELQLVEDPGLPAGGCIIESRFGDIDVGVETQLARTERALVRAED